MENITFCIPYYGPEMKYTVVLETCLRRIRLFYPNNPIIICKTSDSFLPDMDIYTNVNIFNTYVDGSHIIGAIECLVRECKTTHFIVCHDSMFLLKPLPESILNKSLYPLWSFNVSKYDYYNILLSYMYEDFSKKNPERTSELRGLYDSELWYGIFGPSFGGQYETLKIFWSNLNINTDTIYKYLGRIGLMVCERYFALHFTILGIDTTDALNGDIHTHPNVHKECIIPDFDTVDYETSYFYKIWQWR